MMFFTIILLFAASISASPTRVRGLAQRKTQNVLSDAWGGLMVNTPTNNTFLAIGTTFIVPEVRLPNVSGELAAGTYTANIWTGLGMDADLGFTSKNSSIFKAGIQASATKLADGTQTTQYHAWYQWLPDHSVDYNISDFQISAGDKISTTIETQVFGPTLMGAEITFMNLRTNQSQNATMHSVVTPTSLDLLGSCFDLIVSDNIRKPNSLELQPMADFGEVNFQIMMVGTKAPFEESTEQLLQNAENFTIVVPDPKMPQGRPVTETTVNGTSVLVKYLGGA